MCLIETLEPSSPFSPFSPLIRVRVQSDHTPPLNVAVIIQFGSTILSPQVFLYTSSCFALHVSRSPVNLSKPLITSSAEYSTSNFCESDNSFGAVQSLSNSLLEQNVLVDIQTGKSESLGTESDQESSFGLGYAYEPPEGGSRGASIEALLNTKEVMYETPSSTYLAQRAGLENASHLPFLYFLIQTHSNGLPEPTSEGSSVQS